MSDLVKVALITGCLTTLNTIVTLINGQAQARHAANADRKREELKAQLNGIHRDVDGKMAELLRINGEAEKAKGNLQGRVEQKAEGKQ